MSAAVILLKWLKCAKRSAAMYGSEADPGTSPTAWDGKWEGKPECPN